MTLIVWFCFAAVTFQAGTMAKDPLAEAGFYFDELNKLRVLEPEVNQSTMELKEECKEFVDSEFYQIIIPEVL